jgi:hypothetical protein
MKIFLLDENMLLLLMVGGVCGTINKVCFDSCWLIS